MKHILYPVITQPIHLNISYNKEEPEINLTAMKWTRRPILDVWTVMYLLIDEMVKQGTAYLSIGSLW